MCTVFLCRHQTQADYQGFPPEVRQPQLVMSPRVLCGTTTFVQFGNKHVSTFGRLDIPAVALSPSVEDEREASK